MSTPQELFKQAADLIENGLVQLDTKKQTCNQCGGLHHFSNKDEYVAWQKLADTPGKLRQYAEKLDAARRRKQKEQKPT